MSEALAHHLSGRDLAAFAARKRWLTEARTSKRQGKQIPPPDEDWQILLLLAGRGFGKTVAGVQWMWWERWRLPETIGHIIAPTLSDVDGTAFEGAAGFRSIVPAECLFMHSWEKAFNRQRHTLRFSNGSIIRGFGAVDEGGRLRGPQAHDIFGDEIREWDKPAGNLEQALNNALLGLRLPKPDGSQGRAVLATTPKPIPYMKRLMKRSGVRIVTGSSHENLSNLSDAFKRQILAMSGTLMGRQEIDAAFIDEESDQSIIKRHWIKLWPHDRKLPDFQFIVEVYDTASSEENFDRRAQETDPTGSIVLGVFNTEQQFTKAELKKVGVRCRYAAIVLDCWTQRLGMPELLEKAREQHRLKWGPTPGRKSDMVLIEDKSSGPGVRQMLAKWGVPCWPYNPGRRDKAMRLHAQAPIIQQGGMWVIESGREDRKGLPRDWYEPFLEELCAYAGPGSTEHDEYIDCTSMGFDYLSSRGMLEATPRELHIDLEAKLDADRGEAEETRRNSRREQVGNPYG